MTRRGCGYPGCPNTTRRGSGRCHVHRFADRGASASTPLPAGYLNRAESRRPDQKPSPKS